MVAMPRRVRAAALISAGAIGVHDLRYLIAYRGSAAHELSVQGHGYLRFVTPLVVGVLILLLADFAGRLFRTGDASRPLSTRRLWPLLAATLVLIYACQEWVEGMVAEGHPGGIAGVFGSGGWVALPLALVVGLLIALALRVAEATVTPAPLARMSLRLRPLVAIAAASVWCPTLGRRLARRLAPRGPPLAAG
jgi:hypothetical protein